MTASVSVATAIGDAVTMAIWSLLAVCAVALVRRLHPTRRGAWQLVALCCSVIAIDKVIDLQTFAYQSMRWLVHASDSVLGFRGHHALLRLFVLVLGVAVAVGVTVWLVRRDRHLDRGKWLAISGLVVVLVFIAARMLPRVDFSETAGWACEGVAIVLIGWGQRLGWVSARHVE